MTRLNAKWTDFFARGQAWDRFWQDAASGAPAANGCALATAQAAQSGAAALVQHQHLAAAGSQVAQASAAIAEQHQHLVDAGTQAAQTSAFVSSAHQHLALGSPQALQASGIASEQHQSADLVAAQGVQEADADLHSHVHLEAETQQAAQASEAQASQHQHAGLGTAQAAQASTPSAQQTDYLDLAVQQGSQRTVIAAGEAVNSLVLAGAQAAQESDVVGSAEAPPEVNSAAAESLQMQQGSAITLVAEQPQELYVGGYVPLAREPAARSLPPKRPETAVNSGRIDAAQGPQLSSLEVFVDPLYLSALFDLDPDLYAAMAA